MSQTHCCELQDVGETSKGITASLVS